MEKEVSMAKGIYKINAVYNISVLEIHDIAY